MSFKNTLLIALFAGVTAASATDVKPIERFGSLVVKVPKEFRALKLPLPTIRFVMNGSGKGIAVDAVNKIAAGTGCLKVSTAFGVPFELTKCGVEILPEQTTELSLAGIRVTPDKAGVDVGPQLLLKLHTSDKNYSIVMGNVIAMDIPRETVVLVPEMTIDLNISHPEVDYNYTQKFQTKAGEVSPDVINMTEGRGYLQVVLVDGLSKFKEVPFNYIMAIYAAKLDHSETSLAPRYSTSRNPGRSENMALANYYRFSSKELDTKIRAFPLKQVKGGPSYYLAVNEHAVDFTIASGQTTVVPIATLNVHSFNTKRTGVFKLNSDRNEAGHLAPIKTMYDQFSRDLSIQEFANESSLFLPFGYKYRFDFYALDDLGKKSMQDQVEVDLTKAP